MKYKINKQFYTLNLHTVYHKIISLDNKSNLKQSQITDSCDCRLREYTSSMQRNQCACMLKEITDRAVQSRESKTTEVIKSPFKYPDQKR